MEIIKKRFKPDIIVIGRDEMDAVKWDEVNCGCIYLDIWGRFHLELNHKGFVPKLYNVNWWDLLVRQDRFYKKLPFRVLNACKTKPVKDLMGARQFIYYRKWHFLFPSNVGILPWDYMKQRGDVERNPHVGDIRRNAFAALFDVLDEVAHRLGARMAYFPTATIPAEKMRKYGCHPATMKGFGDHLLKFLMTFPLRNIKIYTKLYPQHPR